MILVISRLLVTPKKSGFKSFATSETATMREIAYSLIEQRKSKVMLSLVKNVIYFHASTSSLTCSFTFLTRSKVYEFAPIIKPVNFLRSMLMLIDFWIPKTPFNFDLLLSFTEVLIGISGISLLLLQHEKNAKHPPLLDRFATTSLLIINSFFFFGHICTIILVTPLQ